MPTKSKVKQILVAASGITGIVGDLTNAGTNTGGLTNVGGGLTNV